PSQPREPPKETSIPPRDKTKRQVHPNPGNQTRRHPSRLGIRRKDRSIPTQGTKQGDIHPA
ncbi:hypothetical protein BDD12DRAFT_743722, partial [Trichophaea hybrida]